VLFYVFNMVFPPDFINKISLLARLRGRKSAKSTIQGEKIGNEGEKIGALSTTIQGVKIGALVYP